MRVVYLNIWHGRLILPFKRFLEEQAPQTDFFCFQEVIWAKADLPYPELNYLLLPFQKIEEVLPDFQGYYVPFIKTNAPEVSFGTAMFAKKGQPILTSGNVQIYDQTTENWVPRRLQYLRTEVGGQKLTVVNLHGASLPGDKQDTPGRLEQSKRILEFVREEAGEVVLGGDFNLMPQTESIAILEKGDLKNLIKEYRIASTRSELDRESYGKNDRQYFADYCFVTPGIEVQMFEVPKRLVSDHLPLILDFSLA